VQEWLDVRRQRNFADRVLVYFAVNSVPPFSLRGAYSSATMPTDAPVTMMAFFPSDICCPRHWLFDIQPVVASSPTRLA
jgi:hypothetical protein